MLGGVACVYGLFQIFPDSEAMGFLLQLTSTLLGHLTVCTRTLCIKSLVSEALVAIFSWGLRIRNFLELRCLDEPSASYIFLEFKAHQNNHNVVTL